MNQILDYNPNKSSGGGSTGSDKVVRIFAILLALFAIVLLGVGGVTIYKNQQTEVVKPEDVTEPSKAKIVITKNGTDVIIQVSHDKAIKKIVYKWEDGKEKEIDCNGKTEVEEKINLLAGDHTLIVKVIDVDDNESSTSKSFESEVGEDKEKPTIDVHSENGIPYATVTATDETEMDFVTYRWNDGEEIKVEAEQPGQKTITFNVDILNGQNDLVIVAVDKNNNSVSVVKPFLAKNEPEVQVVVAPDKSNIEVKVTHENGVKSIDIVLNGGTATVPMNEPVTEITFTVPLERTKNHITIIAKSVDDTTANKEMEIDNEDVSADDVTITITQSEEDKYKAIIRILSPEGIKEVGLNLNDVDIPFGDISQYAPEQLTDFSFELPLVNGNNKIIVNAVKPNNVSKTQTAEFYVEE